MTKKEETGQMDDATAVMRRWVKAQEEKDLDALVSCWHPDVDTVHLLRPERSWHGTDGYRSVMARIWESDPANREEIISTGVVDNRIYMETLTHHADGSKVPGFAIMEVEDGQIRRARVYTDRPTQDGLSMDGWVHEMNK
jgi:limonene-1,2-epoxide hydrolase